MTGRAGSSLRRMVLLALGLAAAVLAPACGYRAGLAPDIEPGRSTTTIGIEIFGNESPVPNLERRLHEALTDAARRHSSLVIVSPERADLVIGGAIEGFWRHPGARTGNNRLVEAREVVTVSARLVDRSKGRTVGSTRTEVGFGEALDVPGREFDPRGNALRNAADRVLLTLLAGLEHGVVRPEEAAAPAGAR